MEEKKRTSIFWFSGYIAEYSICGGNGCPEYHSLSPQLLHFVSSFVPTTVPTATKNDSSSEKDDDLMILAHFLIAEGLC